MFLTWWTHSQFFIHAYSKLENSYAKLSNLKADIFCDSCITNVSGMQELR